MAKKKNDLFEDSLKKLQVIVDKMERGDLPLEEAVESFSEGMRLVQLCHQRLEEAESRVQMLLKGQHGEWTIAPFVPSPQGGNSSE